MIYLMKERGDTNCHSILRIYLVQSNIFAVDHSPGSIYTFPFILSADAIQKSIETKQINLPFRLLWNNYKSKISF